jgi:hypothetical protein
MLGASLMFSTRAEVTTAYNFKRLTQARYAAEAGAQNTANWIIYNYTLPTSFGSYDMTQSPVKYNNQPVVLSAMNGVSANYPDSTVQSSFNSALLNKAVPGLDVGVTTATTATLKTMRLVIPFGGATLVPLQSWLIRSQATLAASQAQVEVTTTIEKFGSPVFSYAAFGVANVCGSVTFQGGGDTDSFDSSAGSYAATQENSAGNVGTNGNVTVGGTTTVINGVVQSPLSTTGTCTGGGAATTGLSENSGATVTGGLVTLSSTQSFATPAAPSPAPPTTTQNTSGSCGGISGCTALAGPKNLAFAPGQYGNLAISAGTTIHLSQGVYNINSISLAGGSALIVDSGPVVLDIDGAGVHGSTSAVDLTGGTVSNLTTGKPTDLQILYGGSQPVKVPGGVGSYGVVYAPAAPVTVTGGSNWYGSIIGSTVTDTGGTAIHYDRSLSSTVYIIGNYHSTSFGWSKY